MNRDILESLSVRIIANNLTYGSGVLFLPNSEKAYIITAAHIFDKIPNGSDVIFECYYDSDFVNNSAAMNASDFSFVVKKDNVKVHNGYSTNNKLDVAGIEVERRYWMDDRETFYVAQPIKRINGSCVGYPLLLMEDIISSSSSEIDYSVDSFTNSTNTMNIKLKSETITKFENLVNDLKGVSGSGLFCDVFNGPEVLSGLWKGSKTRRGVGGVFVGAIYTTLIELCEQEGWIPPQEKLIVKSPSSVQSLAGDYNCSPVLYEAIDKYVSTSAEADISMDLDPDIQKRIERIGIKLHEGKVNIAINSCKTLINECERKGGLEREIALLHVRLSQGYIYMGDFDSSVAALENIESFPNKEKAEGYLTLANIEMLKQNYSQARILALRGLEADESNRQLRTFALYMEIVLSDIDEQQAIEILEAQNRDNSFSTKDAQQLYSSIGNMLVQKYRNPLLAIEFHKKAKNIQGDYICDRAIASNYARLGFEENNIEYLVNAVTHYDLFLSSVDDGERNRFFSSEGGNFINLLLRVERNDLILKYIDVVMRNTTDLVALKDMRIIKANSAMILNKFRIEYARDIPKIIMESMVLHKRFVDLGSDRLALDDIDYQVTYDREFSGVIIPEDELKLVQATNQFRSVEDELIRDIMKLINSQQLDDQASSAMFNDLLWLLLSAKDVENYERYLNIALNRFPGDSRFIPFRFMFDEINGNLESAYRMIKQELETGLTIQNAREAMSFFTRNRMFNELRQLYKDIVESDVGRFEREELIYRYIEYLSIPLENRIFAAREFMLYEKELSVAKRNELANRIGIMTVPADTQVEIK